MEGFSDTPLWDKQVDEVEKNQLEWLITLMDIDVTIYLIETSHNARDLSAHANWHMHIIMNTQIIVFNQGWYLVS